MIPLPTIDEIATLDHRSAAPFVSAAQCLRAVIEEAETEKARALLALRQALFRVNETPLEPADRDALARILYWCHTDIAARDISTALGFLSQRAMMATIGPVSSGVSCADCAAPLPASNRSQLGALQKCPQPRCDFCEEKRCHMDEADDEWIPPEEDAHPGEAWQGRW